MYKHYIPVPLGLYPSDRAVRGATPSEQQDKKHYILLLLALACFILCGVNATADSISFDLITTAKTNVNAISLYLDNGAIHKAADLATAIPNCTAVAYWDAATQSYIEHTAGKPFNNFNVTPGHAYFVTVSAPATWTLTGNAPADLSFQLQTTATTNVNAIVIPKDFRAGITDAASLATAIPNCTAVAYWDAATQSYIEHTAGKPFNNFAITKRGIPYFVTVSAAAIWPNLPESSTRTVSGHTYYAGTTIPVSGVLVAIDNITDTTGGDGAYELPNVPAGIHTVTATKTDYTPYSSSINVPAEGLIKDIEMTSGSYTHNLDGTVINKRFENLQGVKVTVLNPDGSSSKLVDTTDFKGEYLITSVPQGTRTVRFELDDYQTQEPEIFMRDNDRTYDVQMLAVLIDPPLDFTATIKLIQVTLSWTPRTETTLKGYNLYRSATVDGQYTKLNTSGVITGNSYLDTLPGDASVYYYKIASVNIDDAEGPLSPPITVFRYTAEMVRIPAGEFQMGDSFDEGGNDELPVHTVYLDAFYIDKYEVTNAQYAEFLNAYGKNVDAAGYQLLYIGSSYCLIEKVGDTYKPKSGYASHPVIGVGWYGAAAYAQFYGVRLPTEAEWEKAARGGLVGKRYPWGDDIDPTKANYDSDGSRDWITGDMLKYLKPVDSFPPNGYGLHNMAGNVWECCADEYDSDYYSWSPKENPLGPGTPVRFVDDDFTNVTTSRVCRGGSWLSLSSFLRCAFRNNAGPAGTSSYLGFRCAQDP